VNDQIKSVDQYWKKNIQIVSILLTIWFFASFGFGIIFANRLDEISFFGFNLGFWFAQQGSIFIFVIIIFIYIRLMKNLDQQYKDNTNNKKQT
jgi:putative solute:sodium symporter small subunit